MAVIRSFLLVLLAAVSLIQTHGNSDVNSIASIPKNNGLADDVNPKANFEALTAIDNSTTEEAVAAAASTTDSQWTAKLDNGDAHHFLLPVAADGLSTQAGNDEASNRENNAAPTNAQVTQIHDIVAVKDEEIASLHDLLQATKAELAEAVSDLNDSFQAYQKLERRIERMDRDHMKDLNETFTELEALSKESKKHERERQLSEERCKDTRKKLADLEYELNKMHYNAVNQYVNFTLIGSDMYEFVHDIVTKTSRHIEKKIGRHHRRANHQRHRSGRHKKSKYTEAKIYLQSKATFAQSAFKRQWFQSTRVRPLLQQTWGKVAKYTSNAYHPYEPIVHEIKESLHLSSLSAVQEVSKFVLAYLDDHVKRKEEMEMRRREREKYRARLSKHKKHTESGEVKLGTTFLHKKMRQLFQFTLDNSERIVKEGTSMLPLFFTLFAGNSLIIGSVLYFVICVPIELIWTIAIAKLGYQVRKYWK
jgi:uncharacterized protein (UPF0297 family)